VTVSFSKYLPWQAMRSLPTALHALLENVLQTVCCKLQKDSGTGGFLASELPFHGSKAQKSDGARSGLSGGCFNGVPPISVSASIATFQSNNTDAPPRLLRHPKKGYF
jgi:hypothetical protein